MSHRAPRTRDAGWGEEMVQRLRALWAEGHSTAEIGRRMGLSKNAIVGKAHRLQLSPRPDPIHRDPDAAGPAPAPRRVARAPALPARRPPQPGDGPQASPPPPPAQPPAPPAPPPPSPRKKKSTLPQHYFVAKGKLYIALSLYIFGIIL